MYDLGRNSVLSTYKMSNRFSIWNRIPRSYISRRCSSPAVIVSNNIISKVCIKAHERVVSIAAFGDTGIGWRKKNKMRRTGRTNLWRKYEACDSMTVCRGNRKYITVRFELLCSEGKRGTTSRRWSMGKVTKKGFVGFMKLQIYLQKWG